MGKNHFRKGPFMETLRLLNQPKSYTMRHSSRMICSKLLKIFDDETRYEIMEIGSPYIRMIKGDCMLCLVKPTNVRKCGYNNDLLIDCDIIYSFFMSEDWTYVTGGTEVYSTYTLEVSSRSDCKAPKLGRKELMLIVRLLHILGIHPVLKEVEEKIYQLIRESEK